MLGFNIFLPNNKIIASLNSGIITIAISIIKKGADSKGDIIICGKDDITGEHITWLNATLATSSIIITPLYDDMDYSGVLSVPLSNEIGMAIEVSGNSYHKVLSDGIVSTIITVRGGSAHLFFGKQNLEGEQIPINVSFDLRPDDIVHLSLTI